MAKGNLYLIDATAFCYRAFYALPSLATSFGQPTGAVYGFLTMLNKILREKKPGYLAVCFDVSRDTFRTKKFTDYKINRPPMPDGLSTQIPLIKKIIKAYGITSFEKEGFEADDVIAGLTKKAKEKGLSVTIVSSDKDILQLVDEETVVFSPYKDGVSLYDQKGVLERFGVNPRQISDIITLMGDDIDNIPGVPGIGEKTASGLIKKFGCLKNLLDNVESVEPERIKKSIIANLDRIKLNQELIVLDQELNLDFNLDEIKIKQQDNEELFRLFKYLEFKKLLKNLSFDIESTEDFNVLLLEDSQLEGWVDSIDELAVYGQGINDLVFFAKDKFFRIDGFGVNLKKILSHPSIKKTGHDLKKIKCLLAEEGIRLEGLYFDTMIAAYLLNPSKSGYTLGDVAWDYLANVPCSGAIDSPKAVSLILELKPLLEKKLQVKSLSNLFRDVEMPLIEVLAGMEQAGIKLDLEIMKRLSKDIEKRLIKLVEEIYQLSGVEFNINSPKQLRDILFERLKLPVIKRSKTGPSTDEEVLRSLSSQHKLPELLLEYRQLMKLKTTYVDTLPGLVDPRTNRIHTSFNQTTTETGRLSSTNPNLQNLPVKTEIGSQIRRAIIAFDEKSYLLSCDYSQIELRVLAHLSKDENLISAFKQDKDIHKTTASLIYNLDEKDITPPMRDTAKRINFGIIYGLSSWGLSRDLGISVENAQGFIDAYFLRYPKVKLYIQEQIKQAKEQGSVTTILGRVRYLPEMNNKNQAVRQLAERQAVNTPIQGSASDLIKLAMIQIDKRIKQEKSRAKILLQIHDELVFDVDDNELDGFIDLVKEGMENVLKLDVPIKVDMKKGKNWLEMEEI